MRNQIRTSDNADRQKQEKFVDGIVEPEKPADFLLKLFDETPDDLYTEEFPTNLIPNGETVDSLRRKLPTRREKIRSVFSNIEERSKQIADLYRGACAEYDLVPKELKIYVVGGRIRQKPLQHNSDVNIVFTTDDQTTGLQPDHNDPSELRKRKNSARIVFVDRLRNFLEEQQLMMSIGGDTNYIIQPKGYGFTDAFVRDRWESDISSLDDRRGVLVYENSV